MLSIRFYFIILFSVLTSSILKGQESFMSEYEGLNPYKNEMNLTKEEIIVLQTKYLQEAIKSSDRRKQFFGYLFLTSAHMRNQDYVTAKSNMLSADSISSLENFPSWKAHMFHRKAILSMRLEDNEEAIKNYEASIPLCKLSNDNVCLGQTYEQLSAMYASIPNDEKADSFYNLCVPLLTKYGSDMSIATLYNNRATIINNRNEPLKSIPYYEKSLAYYEKSNNRRDLAKAKNNLADAYRKTKQYNKALALLRECIQENEKDNFTENLYRNYLNLSAVYDSIGDYKSSLLYYTYFHNMRDSIIGIEKQKEIEELNVQYEVQKKDALIFKKENELSKTRQSNLVKLITFLTLVVFLFIFIFILYFRNKYLKSKLVVADNKVEKLVNVNILKSDKIKELEEMLNNFKNENPQLQDEANFKGLPQNFSILTNYDWIVFKEYFENVNPKYIQRLRDEYPALTEAEERLFMLLKLKFNSKEIAIILGIANDSVKKTRSRLRKKLDLNSELNLDNFIEKF